MDFFTPPIQLHKISCEWAFSGLEASIVLVAFVVVASVFSFTMLGAGFFATAKTQEVTYGATNSATSTLIQDGYIYGSYSTQLDEINFYVKVPEGNSPCTLSDITFFYSSNKQTPQVVTATFPNGETEIQSGERALVKLSGLPGPTRGQEFTLEIKPPAGATSLITRHLPSNYAGGAITIVTP